MIHIDKQRREKAAIKDIHIEIKKNKKKQKLCEGQIVTEMVKNVNVNKGMALFETGSYLPTACQLRFAIVYTDVSLEYFVTVGFFFLDSFGHFIVKSCCNIFSVSIYLLVLLQLGE